MRSALFLAILLCATGASAQIYRWVDDKGTVHYSNSSPPNGVKATVFDSVVLATDQPWWSPPTS